MWLCFRKPGLAPFNFEFLSRLLDLWLSFHGILSITVFYKWSRITKGGPGLQSFQPQRLTEGRTDTSEFASTLPCQRYPPLEREPTMTIHFLPITKSWEFLLVSLLFKNSISSFSRMEIHLACTIYHCLDLYETYWCIALEICYTSNSAANLISDHRLRPVAMVFRLDFQISRNWTHYHYCHPIG